MCRARFCRCLPHLIPHPDFRHSSGHRGSLEADPWRELRQSFFCLSDQLFLFFFFLADLCGGASLLQNPQKFCQWSMCRDALGCSCLIRRDGRCGDTLECSCPIRRSCSRDGSRWCRTRRGQRWLGHCCPWPEKPSQLGLACGRGGVSEVRPGLVHGPRPSSDQPVQRLRIVAAVHVVADADDLAAAAEKNAWAPLI